MQKGAPRDAQLSSLGVNGRGGQIRTGDPLHPMQVRYRAALRPDILRVTFVPIIGKLAGIARDYLKYYLLRLRHVTVTP